VKGDGRDDVLARVGLDGGLYLVYGYVNATLSGCSTVGRLGGGLITATRDRDVVGSSAADLMVVTLRVI